MRSWGRVFQEEDRSVCTYPGPGEDSVGVKEQQETGGPGKSSKSHGAGELRWNNLEALICSGGGVTRWVLIALGEDGHGCGGSAIAGAQVRGDFGLNEDSDSEERERNGWRYTGELAKHCDRRNEGEFKGDPHISGLRYSLVVME